MEAASIAHAEHHGPPAAHRSSRVDAPTLGMLLFIISEVMIFGAFFTAYFFIRVVNHDPWPAPGHEAPRGGRRHQHGDPALLVADDPLGADVDQARQPLRARPGCSTTFLLGVTFLFDPDQRVRPPRLRAPRRAQATIFYALTGLHGAHVFIGLCMLLMVTIRSFRGHYSPEHHQGMEVPGIYWHFVDIMWVVVYTTVYVL